MHSPNDSPAREPIAIVGLGCRFPGGADSPEAFWDLLLRGFDAIGEAPARVGLDAFLDPTPQRPGAVLHKLGGYLPDLEEFDARFFQMSPIEAARLDPQQRLALMVSWEALEDAGIAADRITDKTGVFLGNSADEYGQRIFEDPVAVDPYSLSGGGRSFISARVSYFLDLRGPSMMVDTACSSSLTAVHMACRSLREGECRLAIAGGVGVLMQVPPYVGLFRGGMIAKDGRCKSFDAAGDGFTRSEGAGVVILKTLTRAMADGDRIYALVRGTAVTCDGRASGLLLTPGQSGQEEVVREACADARIDPRRVTYVEAHGTGTVAGDPVEMASLAAVIGKDRDLSDRCLVGSVKSNIGHLEAAAGIAGLIKTALALHHRTVPANLHFNDPNPAIPWSTLPFDIAATTVPLARDRDIFASINSFGLGGQNAHAVLQSIPLAPHRATPPSGRTHLIPITAHTPSALQTLAGRLAERLTAPDPPALSDLAYTGAVRRARHDVRAGVIADTRESLAASLELLKAGAADLSLVTGETRRSQPKLAFVFSGHGAQWAGMGRSLYLSEPVFRDAIDEIDRELALMADWSLVDEMSRDDATSRLDQLDVAQPYIFAVQVALAALYRSWGIVPDATVGHSMGEAAAAHAAGALSVRDALRIVSTRTQLINRRAGPGAMAVVELPEEIAREAIAQYGDHLWIGGVNAPNGVVISGDIPAVEAIVSEMEARGIFTRRIRVSCASHSGHMDPVLPELFRELQVLEPRNGPVPFYSTVEGARVDGGTLDAAYWCRNLRQTVLLKHAIQQLADDGYTAFLEVGHHPVLTISIAATLEGRPSTLLTSLRRDEPERANLLRAAAALWVGGRDLTADAFAPDGGAFGPWPIYPWEPKRYWLEDVVSEERMGKRQTGPHPLLGPAHRSSLAPGLVSWPSELDPSVALLDDHRVGGQAVLPATGYVEMMLAAARERSGAPVTSTAILDMQIFEATVFSPGKTQRLDVAAAGHGETFTVRISGLAPDGSWSPRAQGTIASQPSVPAARVDIGEIRARCASLISGDAHVGAMAERGIQYGPQYRGIAEIWRRDGESIGSIIEPAGKPWSSGPYIVHPALLDVCLQIAIAALPTVDGDNATVLPVSIQELRIAGDPSTVCFSHAIVTEDAADGALTANIRLLDETGDVLIDISGLRVQRLDNTGPSQDDDCLFEVGYRELPAIPSAALHGRWVLAGDGGGMREDLAARIAAAGGEAIDESWWTGRAAPIRGVVCLWPLDLAAPETAADASAIVPLLHALEGQSATDGPLELVFVTRGAQTVPGSDDQGAHHPVQSMMAAIGHVIAFEHPELTIKCIDLPPGARDATGVVDELGGGDAQDIVLRGGKRLTPKLASFARGSAPRLFRAGKRSYAIHRDTAHHGRFKEAVRRRPKSGQVEIEVRFASLDGRSGVGDVSAVGPDVSIRIGQRVLVMGSTELVARHAIIDATLVWPVPANVEEPDAAIQPSIWLSAVAGLGRLGAGDRIRVAGGGAIAAAVRALAGRAGALVTGDGQVDVLIELEAGAATSADLAALRPGGRWATIAAPGADPFLLEGSSSGPNRARVHVDVRTLVEQAPAYVRELLDSLLPAVQRGELAPIRCRRIAAGDLGGDTGADDNAGVCVQIPGAALPIVRTRRAGRRDGYEGTWVITGGFGGIGRRIALHLVEALGARGIVLASRTAADPSDISRLDLVSRLQRGGASVRVEGIDVGDADAVASLFARLGADSTLPPLCGVIHAAGVLDDGLLARLDRERFKRVFEPKMQGAWNLHRATLDLDLEHFVLFASQTALFGNPGQGNYAAANAYLDALAWDRARAGLPALSIGWGAWDEVGMVAGHQARIDNMESAGQILLSPELGVRLFERVLDSDAVVVYAMQLDRAKLAGTTLGSARHLLSLLGTTAAAGGETLDRAAVLKLTGASRLEAIVRFVRVQIGEVVSLDWRGVPEDQPLGRIGLDSLMAVAVRSRIVRALGVTVPLVGILGGASALDIGRHVDGAIGADAVPRTEAPADAEATLSDDAERRAAAQLAARQRMRRERRAGKAV